MQFDDLQQRRENERAYQRSRSILKSKHTSEKTPVLRSIKASNIASQPKYSPLRYPGGKTWLIPQIREWLGQHPIPLLVEPFAGGATASLVAILEGYAERSVMIERDPYISALWRTILSRDAEWLVDKIMSFKCNRKNAKRVLREYPRTFRHAAFQAIVRNRVCRGGILNNSAKLMRKGERGRGIRSRWYPETLALRIAQIYNHRQRFTFIHGDGIQAIQHFAQTLDEVRFFVDPPYPIEDYPLRRRLYTYNQLNHQRLFAVLASVPHDFLMTNDDSRFIREIGREANFLLTSIRMRNAHGLPRRELLIRPHQ